MPKISAINSKGLFVPYILKIIISTILSVVLFNAIISLIILKLDVDLSAVKYITIVIDYLTAIIICAVSITGFKNNYLLMSVISIIPFVIFVFVNFLINSSDSLFFALKVVGIIVCAVFVALLKSAKKR